MQKCLYVILVHILTDVIFGSTISTFCLIILQHFTTTKTISGSTVQRYFNNRFISGADIVITLVDA